MDNLFVFFLIFFLGASLASFLQMYVSTEGKNIFIKKSKCDGCQKNLSWYELIPVLSWLKIYTLNRGIVNCCSSNKVLDWRYLFGEVVLGLWFVGAYEYFDYNVFSVEFVLSLLFGCIFFILIMEDLEDMEVSSKHLYLLCAVSVSLILFQTLFSYNLELLWSILFPIIIFLPFWLIYLLGRYIDKPMIGEADPYVFTALGVFFGTQFSISLFMYSVWIGAFIGVGYLFLVNKKFERNIRIPFLPIIFLASIFILITGFHIIRIQDILIINEIFFKN